MNYIYAKQGLLHPQQLGDAAGGGPCSQDVGRAVPHELGGKECDLVLELFLACGAIDPLSLLHQHRLVGRFGYGIEPGLQLSCSVELLVYIHDLRLSVPEVRL